MSWLDRRRPQREFSHRDTRVLPQIPLTWGDVFRPFNEHLKALDRRGELDAYMAAWHEREREREAAP
jgi:hypothetical protein